MSLTVFRVGSIPARLDALAEQRADSMTLKLTLLLLLGHYSISED